MFAILWMEGESLIDGFSKYSGGFIEFHLYQVLQGFFHQSLAYPFVLNGLDMFELSYALVLDTNSIDVWWQIRQFAMFASSPV